MEGRACSTELILIHFPLYLDWFIKLDVSPTAPSYMAFECTY